MNGLNTFTPNRTENDLVLLWDFDGTLVDTAALWRAAEFEFLRSHGIRWTDEASNRLIGGNLDLASDVIAEMFGIRFTIGQLKIGMTSLVETALDTSVPWMNGAERLLRTQCEEGIASALVTSSYSSTVTIALKSLPFSPFATVVCRDDVEKPKPDPEPYLLAMDRLSVNGRVVVAIEDSPSGVASALAAGCHVVAVGEHAADIKAAGQAVHRIERLSELDLKCLPFL